MRPRSASRSHCCPQADLLITQTDFALETLSKLSGLVVDPAKTLDVHAVARRLRSAQSNSLDAWAGRLGVHRTRFLGAWHCTAEAQCHCELDAKLIGAIYVTLLGKMVA